MRGGRRAAGPALLAAFAALAACSEPAPPPAAPLATVRLSTENPDANAAAVAAFVRRTCLDTAGDAGALAAAVQGSGWNYEQVPAADPAMSISLWRLDHGELVHALVEVAPGARIVDCQVELEGAVAPSIASMRAALGPVIRQPSMRELGPNPAEVGWQWRQAGNQEWRLTIGPPPRRRAAAPANRPAVAIHAAVTERPPDPPSELAPAPELDTNLGADAQGR